MTVTEPLPTRIAERLETASALDVVIAPISRLVRRVPAPLLRLLHGEQVGHPVHPAIVLVPAGVWTGAAVLDVLPGGRRAARTLVGAGVLAAVPAIAAGWADWSRLRRDGQRVGLVHAAANESATGLYAVSWLARRAGHHGLGAALGFAGIGLLTVAGYLGGHLTYRQGAGVDAVPDPTFESAADGGPGATAL